MTTRSLLLALGMVLTLVGCANAGGDREVVSPDGLETSGDTAPAPDPENEVAETVAAPTLRLVEPMALAVVAGWVRLSAEALGFEEPVQVVFTFDDQPLATDGVPPYVTAWSTVGVSEGQHRLGAYVAQMASVVRADPVEVLVDHTPPEGLIVASPAAHSLVGDELRIEVQAQDANSVARVTASVPGAEPVESAAVPAALTLSLAAQESGPVTLTVTAVDPAGNACALDVPLILDRPPLATLESPPYGTWTWTPFLARAACGDREGASRLTWTLDGQVLAEEDVAPGAAATCRLAIDPTHRPEGPHTLGVRSKDSAGQETSHEIAVAFDPPLRAEALVCAPGAACRAYAEGIRVWGLTTVQVEVRDDDPLTEAVFQVNGLDVPTSMGPPITVSIDTTGYYDGPLHLVGGLTSNSGQQLFLELDVLVRNHADLDHDGVDGLNDGGSDCDDTTAAVGPEALDLVDGACAAYDGAIWSVEEPSLAMPAEGGLTTLHYFEEDPRGRLRVVRSLWGNSKTIISDDLRSPDGVWSAVTAAFPKGIPSQLLLGADDLLRAVHTSWGYGMSPTPVEVWLMDHTGWRPLATYVPPAWRKLTAAWLDPGDRVVLAIDSLYDHPEAGGPAVVQLVDDAWIEVPLPPTLGAADSLDFLHDSNGRISVVAWFGALLGATWQVPDGWAELVPLPNETALDWRLVSLPTAAGPPVVGCYDPYTEGARVALPVLGGYASVSVDAGRPLEPETLTLALDAAGAPHLQARDRDTDELLDLMFDEYGLISVGVVPEVVVPSLGTASRVAEGTLGRRYALHVGAGFLRVGVTDTCLAIADGGDANCDGADGVDLDGDGFASSWSGGSDRYDDLADVNPAKSDPVGDLVDSNGDGLDGVDQDADGVASVPSGGPDCDDQDPNVRPGHADAVAATCERQAWDVAVAPTQAGTSLEPVALDSERVVSSFLHGEESYGTWDVVITDALGVHVVTSEKLRMTDWPLVTLVAAAKDGSLHLVWPPAEVDLGTHRYRAYDADGDVIVETTFEGSPIALAADAGKASLVLSRENQSGLFFIADLATPVVEPIDVPAPLAPSSSPYLGFDVGATPVLVYITADRHVVLAERTPSGWSGQTIGEPMQASLLPSPRVAANARGDIAIVYRGVDATGSPLNALTHRHHGAWSTFALAPEIPHWSSTKPGLGDDGALRILYRSALAPAFRVGTWNGQGWITEEVPAPLNPYAQDFVHDELGRPLVAMADTSGFVALVAQTGCEVVGDAIDRNCDGLDGIDFDGDGVASTVFGGTDCDDLQASVYPGAVDAPGDGIDADCDGIDGGQTPAPNLP